MVDEAKLISTASGLVPEGDGWFVVNVRDAAWLRRDGLVARAGFEADGRLGVEERLFPELGIKLGVFEPGEPSTMYHAETAQEDFLVLAGECVAIIEGQERPLHAWDFVHCPAGTRHSFVGAGDGPCVLLCVGARPEEGSIVYPVDPVASARGAGVAEETDSPAQAYAAYPPWEARRPDRWDELPWA